MVVITVIIVRTVTIISVASSCIIQCIFVSVIAVVVVICTIT